jgi:tetratricopeptide (TPR) repeat protein
MDARWPPQAGDAEPKNEVDLASAFPAPRDDEPPELRARIVKELRDHLQCAYRAELLKTGDETIAARRVIVRFGDPARLARKLWFDAMQEKIMSQRIVLGIVAILAAACLAMGGIALSIATQLAEQGRETNVALVSTLDRLLTNAESQKSMTWVDARLQFVKDRQGGQPAAGYSIAFRNSDDSHATAIKLNGKSDAQGLFDVGMLAPAQYNAVVETPWGELARLDVYVRPGKPVQTFEFVCPGEPATEHQAMLDVDWPNELRNEQLGLLLYFPESPRPRELAGAEWTRELAPRDEHDLVLVTTDGILLRSKRGSGRAPPNWEGDTLEFSLDEVQAAPEPIVSISGSKYFLEIAGLVVFDTGVRSQEGKAMRVLVRGPAVNPQDTRRTTRIEGEFAADQALPRVALRLSAGLVAAARRALREQHWLPSGAMASAESPEGDGTSPEGDSGPDTSSQSPARPIERTAAAAEKPDFEASLAEFNEAIRKDPQDVNAVNGRAWLWKQKGEFGKAEDDYRETMRLDPQPFRVTILSNLLAERGEFDKAMKELDDGLRKWPRDSSLLVERGDLWEEQHKLGRALEDYEAAVQIAPSDGSAHGALAWILATATDSKYRDGARAVKSATIACDAFDWAYHMIPFLAAAYAEAGDFDVAVKWQAKALEMMKRAREKPGFEEPDDQVQKESEKFARMMQQFESGKPYREGDEP